MLHFFDKVRFCSFLMMGILVCLVWFAGCLDESDTITMTPAPVTPLIQAKFVKGDIIAKTAASADPYFIILNYDSMTGRYERAFVYQKTDGSWYRYNNKSEFSDRDLIEKIYPAKVGYVHSVSLIPVKTPVPVLVTPKVVPVPSKTGAPPSQSLDGMAPVARFTASPVQGRSPLYVQFTGTSVSAGTTSYQWDLNNDGVVDSSAKNPVYAYQKVGNYTVKLTVTNAGGSDSEVKTNYIRVSSAVTPTPVPTPTITPVPTQTPVIQSGECFGAACNPTGNPIGGGAGYTRIISETDSSVKYVVSTRDQLLTALKSAKSGEVLFVKGTAVIDLTGSSPLTIPAGVTLASDRGRAGSSGALIKKSKGAQNVGWAEPTFTAAGNNVRVTGIRLEGEMYPSTSSPVVSESQYLVGIYSKDHTGLEVDNCEIRGWAWAGVYASNANTPGANGVYVHHNYIHYSLARSEGYGIQIDGANVIIEANIFDNNRHSIAAGGLRGEGYEARYNIHLGHGTGIGFASFDIHASEGNVYKMHHNTFETTSEYIIGIQSSGAKKTYIDHNIFKTTYGNHPIFQQGSANLFVTNNYCNGALFSGSSIVDYF